MSRYNKTKKSVEYKKSKRYLLTTIYQDVPERNDDILVITQNGDRFDNLANQFYGDPTLWWFIARANNMVTMNVEVGKHIRIPANTAKAKGR